MRTSSLRNRPGAALILKVKKEKGAEIEAKEQLQYMGENPRKYSVLKVKGKKILRRKELCQMLLKNHIKTRMQIDH